MNRRELLQVVLAAPLAALLPSWIDTSYSYGTYLVEEPFEFGIEGIKRIWVQGRLIYDVDNPELAK